METTGILSLLAGCAKVIKCVQDIHMTYKRAPLALVSIASECNTIHMLLAQLQQIQSKFKDIDSSDEQKQVLGSLEALTVCCQLTLGCVEGMLEELLGEPVAGANVMGLGGGMGIRAKFVLQETEAKELLDQLRGYRGGITSLLATLNTQSAMEIYPMLQHQGAALSKLMQRSKSSWSRRTPSLRSDRRISMASAAVADAMLDADFNLAIKQTGVYRRAAGRNSVADTLNTGDYHSVTAFSFAETVDPSDTATIRGIEQVTATVRDGPAIDTGLIAASDVAPLGHSESSTLFVHADALAKLIGPLAVAGFSLTDAGKRELHQHTDQTTEQIQQFDFGISDNESRKPVLEGVMEVLSLDPSTDAGKRELHQHADQTTEQIQQFDFGFSDDESGPPVLEEVMEVLSLNPASPQEAMKDDLTSPDKATPGITITDADSAIESAQPQSVSLDTYVDAASRDGQNRSFRRSLRLFKSKPPKQHNRSKSNSSTSQVNPKTTELLDVNHPPAISDSPKKLLANSPSEEPKPSLKFIPQYELLLCGYGSVGKTCLITQFVQSYFVDEYAFSLHDSYRKQCVVDDEVALIDILDVTGDEEWADWRGQWYRTVEGFILIYSIRIRTSFEYIKVFQQQILSVKSGRGIYESINSDAKQRQAVENFPMVLVGAMCDDESGREVTTKEGEALAKEIGCPFIEASAKSRVNVDKVFYETVRQIRTHRHKKRREEEDIWKRQTAEHDKDGCVLM